MLNIKLYSFTEPNRQALKYLYPYHAIELKALLFYGENLKRPSCKTKAVAPNIWVSIYMSLAVATLLFIRKKAQLRHRGFFSTVLDVQIAIFAGGNLRVQHKWERLFFGIVLISAFFLLSIVLNSPLYGCAISPERSVTTFEGLAKFKVPIYISKDLNREQDAIIQMLK